LPKSTPLVLGRFWDSLDGDDFTRKSAMICSVNSSLPVFTLPKAEKKESLQWQQSSQQQDVRDGHLS